MEKIDFTRNGGYRLKQQTFAKMQAAYFEILKALTTTLQLNDIGNYIVSGCEVVTPNILPGMMYIDGELCPFAGVVGTAATKIKKVVTSEDLGFRDGSNQDVFKTTTAEVDATGAALSTFMRVGLVIDHNYVHTDVNFTALLFAKLAGLDKPDWDIVNPSTPGYIFNKPTILDVLHQGVSVLGDFPVGGTNTTNILFPDVGTADYLVFGAIKSNSTLGNAGADLIAWFTAGYETNKFRLGGREFLNEPQNIEFHYLIVKA